MRFRDLLASTLCLSILPMTAIADDYLFADNTGDGNWDAAINWLRTAPPPFINAVPGLSDIASISNLTARKIGGTITLSGLQLNTATLSLNGTSLTVTNAQLNNLSILEAVGTGNTITGTFASNDKTGGLRIDLTTGSSDLTIASGGTVSGILFIYNAGQRGFGGRTQGTLTNNGTLYLTPPLFPSPTAPPDVYTHNVVNNGRIESEGGLSLTVNNLQNNTNALIKSVGRLALSVIPEAFPIAFVNNGTVEVGGLSLNQRTVTGNGTLITSGSINPGVSGTQEGRIENNTLVTNGAYFFESSGSTSSLRRLNLKDVTLSGTSLTLDNGARLRFFGTNNRISTTNLRFNDIPNYFDSLFFGPGEGGEINLSVAEGDVALTIDEGTTLSGRLLRLARVGTTTNTATLTNNGTIQITASSFYPAAFALDVLTNNGRIETTATTPLVVQAHRLTNSTTGVIAARNGNLSFVSSSDPANPTAPYSFVNNGTISVTNGNLLLNGNTFTGNGTVTVTREEWKPFTTPQGGKIVSQSGRLENNRLVANNAFLSGGLLSLKNVTLSGTA